MKAKIYSIEEIHYRIVHGDQVKLVLRASGIANSGGWNGAELLPWVYIDRPVDGVVDFDFVATPPGDIVTFDMPKIDTLSQVFRYEDWIKGVRVHSVSGSKTMAFESEPETPSLMSEDDPAPFPWTVKQ
tara:strand:+ start:159 stop:545 length:387 start_codon:yes stop_codon:yes gene_type:complete